MDNMEAGIAIGIAIGAALGQRGGTQGAAPRDADPSDKHKSDGEPG
jgi:hypothetical protein